MTSVDPMAQINFVGGTERGTPRLEQPKPAKETAQKLRTLRKATSDFESIFLARLLEPMVKSIASSSQGGQFGGGVMLNVAAEKMAESIAGKRGVGLGDMLYQSLKERVLKEAGDQPVEGVEHPGQELNMLESATRKLELLEMNPGVEMAPAKPRPD